MTQTDDLVLRRLEVNIGNQHQIDLVPHLDFRDVDALLVEQEGGDVDRHLAVQGAGVLLHRLLFEDAQDMQGRGLGAADVAGAAAARAGDVAGLGERRAQPLTRQFEQAEAADLAGLDTGAVEVQGIAQPILDFALVARAFHVDEVDHDQAAQVAQAQLARRLVGGFEVGLVGGFLDVGTLGGATGVDVDRDQCFGVVDDDGAAGRQGDLARVGRLDLVFDLEAREQRHVVAVALDPGDIARHHVRHELLRLLEDVVGIDQDFADVRREVVANGADHQARFLVDEERALLRIGGALDRAPELQQVVQIPLQFFEAAADAGGARDQAGARRDFEAVHDLAQFLAILALDATRNTAAARVVGHQHEIAASQRNESGEGRTLVAAFVLVNLDDQFLADMQGVLNPGLARVAVGFEIGTGDFLEWQEAVALRAIFDKCRFEAGLQAGDDGFVDVAFALFLVGRFDVEVNQFLTIDDRDAEFLGLRRIE